MNFWHELRRRSVLKVGTAYVIVAWLIVQVVANLNDPLNLPDWFDTVVVVLLFVGLPIALLLAWAYELTPTGLEPTADTARQNSERRSKGLQLNYLVSGLLIVAVTFLLVQKYLFDSSQTEIMAPVAGTGSEAQSPTSLPKVAVLPCTNLSPRQEDAYFSAGIHDEILNQLVKLRGLLVVSRTSVMQFAEARPSIPEIAAELNAQAVMECTVRFAGTSVLVTAQLIDPLTDAHVFSNTYPADLSDLGSLFAIQADIATNIANALEASYSEEDELRIAQAPTDSDTAYVLYLQSLDAVDRATAISLLDRATDADPAFALAYAEKAAILSYELRDTVGARAATNEADELARMIIELAERALAIDRTVGRAHFALAEVHLQFWRWPQAQAEYAEAQRLNPNDMTLLQRYSWFSTYVGQYERAIRLGQRLRDVGGGIGGEFEIGYANFAAGAIEAANDSFQKMVAQSPAAPLGHHFHSNSAQRLGDRVAAIEALELAETLYGDNIGPLAAAELAHIYARLGMDEEVRRLHARFEVLAGDDDVGAGVAATMYLALGDEEMAYETLRTAAEKAGGERPDSGFNGLMNLKLKLTGDPVLSTARFQTLLDRIGSLD